jgi:glycosyltransferase involved in cell wall biosynthesis
LAGGLKPIKFFAMLAPQHRKHFMQEIVYFGNDWNAENKTSSHHIAEQLSQHTKILYIECPGLRAPKGTGRDLRKLFSKVGRALRPPRQINEQLAVYTLFQLPFHKYALVRTFNKWLIVATLKLLFWLRGIRNPILWFVIPHLYMAPVRIKNALSVYYCIDDYAALPDIDVSAVSAMDNAMTSAVDLVFVASETLLEKKQALNKQVLVSHHGVDFVHFNRVQQGNIHLPTDIPIQKPVIGFFGLIEEWIDLELIRYLATEQPNWQFLMIGRVAVAQNPCEELNNVHFIGRREFAKLPDYAASFDVAILPYKLNQQVLNSNPIKLREYLATGKPVVSVNFPQVHHYADVVSIANDHSAFLQAIEKELAEDSPTKQAARVASVRDATWQSRVQNILLHVNEQLAEKSASI